MMKKYLLGVLVGLVAIFTLTGCESKPFVEDEYAVAKDFVKYRGYTYYWEQNVDSYLREMNAADAVGMLDHTVKNRLIKLDTFGKKEILEDYGNGVIVVYDSKIFTSYARNDDNTKRTIYSVSTFGSNKKEYVDGYLQGRIGSKIIYSTKDGIYYFDAKTDEKGTILEKVSFVGMYKDKIYYMKDFNKETGSAELGLVDNLEDKGTIFKVTIV